MTDYEQYDESLFPKPRPFQARGKISLQEGRKSGHRCQMFMAATGSGKTIMALMIVMGALMKAKRVMFLCDRTTLINQTSDVSDGVGLGIHGVIQAQHWRFNPELPYQIASVQTIAKRGFPENIDLLIIDEAHTQHKTWTNYIKDCSATVIGLSATPFSKGLGKLFSNLVNGATMDELTKEGTLVPFRVYSCTHVNMDGAETTKSGEWTDKAAEERGLDILGDVVQEWKKYAFGLKTLVFGATIKHCEEMCRQFNVDGVLAMTYTSETKDKERRAILEDFNKPDSSIRVLLSVEALAKGFDVPDIGCICDVRPLRKSLSTFMQLFGRGLRSSPETGKEECLLLDFSGNIVRFADDFADVYYNGLDKLSVAEKLDRQIRPDKGDDEIKKCPKCGYTPCGKRCVSCGWEKQSTSVVEHMPGIMSEYIMLGSKRNKIAYKPKDIWQQVCSYTSKFGNPDTAAARAWYIYQDIVGFVPDKKFGRHDVQPTVPISKEVANQIKYRQFKYRAQMAQEARQ